MRIQSIMEEVKTTPILIAIVQRLIVNIFT